MMFRPGSSARALASGPITWRSWLGVVLVALVVATGFAWAFWPGQDSPAQAAVVNLDEPVTVRGQLVPLGRELAGDLVHGEATGYQWVLSDAADAAAKLATGEYAAVVTIPEDFSARATSASGKAGDATQARIRVATSPRAGLVDPAASTDIAKATLDTLNRQVVETYLDNVYVGFGTLHGQLGEAADGADRLADGTGKLREAAGQLATGADTLAKGLTTAERETAQLPALTARLADGARQVADGNTQLAGVVVPLADKVIAIIDALPSATASAKRFTELAASCTGEPAFCAELTAAARRFAADAAVLDGKRAEIRANIVRARDNVRDLAAGARQVAGGTRQLAAQAGKLSGGIGTAARGARELAGGAGQLAGGASTVDSGAAELAKGLDSGRDQVPNYTEAERAHLKQVAATPALADTAAGHFGTAAIALALVLALWAAGLVTYQVVRAVPSTVLTTREPSWRIILAAALPGSVLAGVLALVLTAVFAVWLRLGVLDTLALLLVLALTAATFMVVNQTLVAVLGRPGRLLGVVVLVVTTAAGVLSSVPGAFSAALALLPTQGALTALRAVLLGADGLAGGVAQLVVWLVVGTVAMIAVTDRRRALPVRALRLPDRAAVR
ncbi:putative membrane protein [Crossiella equi]|uniref:Membrane protein n=1 Tax=Crossiella equi TaxID=130796 RepID=A0ABS5AQQ9_9PSEU|nr:YhgE/Pip domain-containing protein [Crossiella equi]MBP2478904.1 putative membrane protein [Crossiella equi]